MPPNSSDIGPVQSRLSDQELGITPKFAATESDKSPAQRAEEQTSTMAAGASEILPDVEAKASPEEAAEAELTPEHAYLLAEKNKFVDPYSTEREQISLLDFLEHQFKDTWYALYSDPNGRDRLGQIASIVMNRLGSPQTIRALAEALRKSPAVKGIQRDIIAIGNRFDELELRFDKAADSEREKLRHKVTELDELKKQTELLHWDIADYLTAVARDWEKSPRLRPQS